MSREAEGPESDPRTEMFEKDLESMGAGLRASASRETGAFQKAFWSRMASAAPDEARAKQPDARVISMAPVVTRRSGRYHWWIIGSAAAILLCFLYTYSRMPAVGYLVYKTGSVQLSQAPTQSNRLDEKTVITTASDGEMLASMDGDRVQLYLGGSGRMRILGDERVALEEGSTWLSVVPQSGLFEVETPAGTVEVHGTSFGIKASADGRVEIYLSSGEIRLHGPGETVMEMQPGDLLVCETGKSVVQTAGIAGKNTPEWVSSLYEDFRLAYDSAYFPSTTGTKAKTANK